MADGCKKITLRLVCRFGVLGCEFQLFCLLVEFFPCRFQLFDGLCKFFCPIRIRYFRCCNRCDRGQPFFMTFRVKVDLPVLGVDDSDAATVEHDWYGQF